LRRGCCDARLLLAADATHARPRRCLLHRRSVSRSRPSVYAGARGPRVNRYHDQVAERFAFADRVIAIGSQRFVFSPAMRCYAARRPREDSQPTPISKMLRERPPFRRRPFTTGPAADFIADRRATVATTARFTMPRHFRPKFIYRQPTSRSGRHAARFTILSRAHDMPPRRPSFELTRGAPPFSTEYCLTAELAAARRHVRLIYTRDYFAITRQQPYSVPQMYNVTERNLS